ncbi:extracellular solute-binding protein [Hoeflea poritis]|uniref:Extracellular solute-binding protein n=1 Tax=Hoeflea poritis TaxID=2993659 RepID=A0ABT4VT85_9HYPH|nr:extracellular solute-binding protein [Hoeflea poritis]MDA4847926.1 extracellular solute-binding protein [Hoeflea poritis]
MWSDNQETVLTVHLLFKRKAPAAAFAALLLTGLFTTIDSSPANADDKVWRHSSSLIGEPKYPPGFERFDYVNPDAPKGGRINVSGSGTFDTLNPILAKGELAEGMGLVYERLMSSSEDEISTEYGLIAEAVSFPDDYSYVSYRLRPEARWHDGEPITVEDVIWSFEKAVELDPQRQFYYQHVTGAEKTGENEVTFTFDEKNNRELPQIIGQLLVLPKHWWEGTDAEGRQRSIEATTLEPPLGSGPYRIARVSPGSTLLFERVDDYWAKDLPVNVGSFNFDEINYTYFADRNVEFEAFKAGELDFWVENAAKRWANEYNFPAAREGRIVREELENPYRSQGVMVGFIPNLRRDKFKDPQVRKALNLAFDFEDLNRTIFFNQYQRIDSFFYGTELAGSGKPEGRVLEILESVRGKVPDEVFMGGYTNPVGGDPQKQRANLREAVKLFRQAGYEIRGGNMVNAETGEPFTFEILLNGPIIERVALPYVENLKKIGIDATVRSVDAAQYANRERSRDFDIIYNAWGQSLSPGNEQFEYWGSAAADRDGSANYAGIADEGIDELIRKVVFAPDREELIAATQALDRVLLAHQYIIPSYTSRVARIAYSDRLAHPDPLPTYGIGFPTIWWSKDAAE